jgi:hypothetical protein
MTRWIMIAATGLLAIVIGLAVVYPGIMISPGPLVTAHSELAADCFACHAPFRGPSAQRCMTCHTPADIGRRTTKGVAITPASGRPPFHEMLASQNCIACHRDHLEPFFTASKMTRFDHSLLTSTVRNSCTTCHAAPDNELHRSRTSSCSQCHDQNGWKPAKFDHSKFFDLDEHHNASCTTCHGSNNYKEYTCFGCHEHQADRIRARHQRKGIQNIGNCVLCHRNAHERVDR